MSHVVHMMSYILWLCYHTYNGGYMIDNLGVMTEIWWMCWRYNRCDVRYNSFDVMNRVLSCHKSW